MPSFKVATYNLENLFNRPRVFQEKEETIRKLLGFTHYLDEELKKDIYNHEKINELEKNLSGFVIVRDIRASHKKAKGAKEWFGFLDFIREDLSEAAVMNTAKVISEIDADILFTIEVENRIVLRDFHDKLLYPNIMHPQGKKEYRYIYVVDGNDERGIDVGIMSRYPIICVTSHADEKTVYNAKLVPLFSRDCLEVQVQLPTGKILHLLINHFKSMGYNIPSDFLSNNRRFAQAQRVNEIVNKFDLENELVIVGGDFNSPVDNPSIEPLLSNKGLYNINNELPENERGTYRTGKQQIDYLLVSKTLRKNLLSTNIERRGIYSRKYERFDSVVDRKSEASDHAAVIGEFKLI